MNKVVNTVGSIMGNIIKKYNFEMVPFNENGVFLVSRGFALIIYINREGVDIYYVVPKNKNELVEYRISNFVQCKFTDKDRANYVNPSTNEERIISELKIFSSGLFNHWGDLLSGDKMWLKKYQGNGTKANQFVTSILVPIFAKQI
jgi:hypothetical protein